MKWSLSFSLDTKNADIQPFENIETILTYTKRILIFDKINYESSRQLLHLLPGTIEAHVVCQFGLKHLQYRLQ